MIFNAAISKLLPFSAADSTATNAPMTAPMTAPMNPNNPMQPPRSSDDMQQIYLKSQEFQETLPRGDLPENTKNYELRNAQQDQIAKLKARSDLQEELSANQGFHRLSNQLTELRQKLKSYGERLEEQAVYTVKVEEDQDLLRQINYKGVNYLTTDQDEPMYGPSDLLERPLDSLASSVDILSPSQRYQYDAEMIVLLQEILTFQEQALSNYYVTSPSKYAEDTRFIQQQADRLGKTTRKVESEIAKNETATATRKNLKKDRKYRKEKQKILKEDDGDNIEAAEYGSYGETSGA